MNNEFVVSYINLIDGEQDPRNLMLIFNMTVIVLQHFNLGNAHLNFLIRLKNETAVLLIGIGTKRSIKII